MTVGSVAPSGSPARGGRGRRGAAVAAAAALIAGAAAVGFIAEAGADMDWEAGADVIADLGAPPAPGGALLAQEPADVPVDTPRAFRHAIHERISCQVCHAAGPWHGTPRVWTARDCYACHHDPALPRACSDCHERADYAPPRLAGARMDLSVWDEARIRKLPFEHDRHEELACRECHREAGTAQCSACHSSHHRPEAECARCHLPPPPAVHGLESHVGCAGSGCHAATPLEVPAGTRSFCLLCHEEQRDHRVGRTCTLCHLMPEPAAEDPPAPNGCVRLAAAASGDPHGPAPEGCEQ